MTMTTILIVEDEKPLVKILKYNMEKEGWRAVSCDDGEKGLDAFKRERPDLVILDLMLPKLDGFEFCRRVRSQSKTPILMLTARKEEVDSILGLELGADDYVTKPFSVRELTARIKAILRRTGAGEASAAGLRAGGIELDAERYETRIKGKSVALSTKEFELLKCLLEAGGRALTREQLLEKVWGYEKGLELDTRTVDQHVKRLREKLGSEANRVLTVKNVGYRLKED
ncbi:MAG: response regulator transcription factor [Elusimicrobia bacterium]|nr:response regulator transcription factor [Elusimicrobiota bacterium]